MTAHAAIHVGLKQLGIDGEDRRDIYERATGKRSLTEMSPREHEAVLGELRRLGFKPGSNGAKNRLQGKFAKQLQALWIDLWNLGLVQDRSDKALIAFVARQTKIEHPRFVLDAAIAAKAIEAMKGWMARAAGVDWSDGNHLAAWQRRPGCRIALAQWALLGSAGLVDAAPAAFKAFVEEHAFNPIPQMTPREWHLVMNTLGERVRSAKKAGALK